MKRREQLENMDVFDRAVMLVNMARQVSGDSSPVTAQEQFHAMLDADVPDENFPVYPAELQLM